MSYTLAHNRFSHLTYEEFKAKVRKSVHLCVHVCVSNPPTHQRRRGSSNTTGGAHSRHTYTRLTLSLTYDVDILVSCSTHAPQYLGWSRPLRADGDAGVIGSASPATAAATSESRRRRRQLLRGPTDANATVGSGCSVSSSAAAPETVDWVALGTCLCV